MVRIRCASCEMPHAFTPMQMAVVINAFQEGDLQRVTRHGVVQYCLYRVIPPPDVMKRGRKGGNSKK